MTKKRLRDDMRYQAARSVAKTMLEKGLITIEEYAEIDTKLLQIYNPYLVVCFPKTLDKCPLLSNI